MLGKGKLGVRWQTNRLSICFCSCSPRNMNLWEFEAEQSRTATILNRMMTRIRNHRTRERAKFISGLL